MFVASGIAVSLATPVPAQAAIIANPVTSITVTPADPRLADAVRTDVAWCVPDSTAAGDTFDIALPVQLVQLPASFDLRDPGGLLVATAHIAGSPPVATFTFTDYVDTHVNVCGTAFFESRLDSSLIPGQTYTLTYVVNSTTTFEPIVTIRPDTTQIGRGTARKGAFFDDPTDQCRTAATGCIGWYIESRLGPFQSITVTDGGVVGAVFECSRLSVTLWSVDAQGNLLRAFDPASVGTTITTTCTPTDFQVVGSNIPANLLMRVLVRATPQQLDPAGGVTFVNSATVTHVSVDGSAAGDNIIARRRSARVGGAANGVQPPPATTVPSTTTTTSPATTTTVIVVVLPPVPAAPVGVPGPAPAASPPQLPATGANPTLLGVGAFMLLLGTSMIMAVRRRVNHANIR